MTTVSRRRAGRDRGTDDRAQLLLLAGFILVMMFLVTSITLSKIASIEAEVARDQRAPIGDEFDFVRSRTNSTMNSLVDTSTSNASFNDTLDSLRSSFSDVETSKGYDLVLELAGATTPAPRKEAGPFAGAGTYENASYDGVRAFCDEAYDGVNDGIFWYDGHVKGFAAYVYLADHKSSIESTVIFAVNTDSGSSDTCGDWVGVENGSHQPLNDVAKVGSTMYAVGDDGDVLERQAHNWTAVDRGGPGDADANLNGLDPTDDGDRFWVVGTGGTVGEYWTDNGTVKEHHDNIGTSNELTDVAVTGSGGEATVYATDDSGNVHYSEDGGDNWDSHAPGGSSRLESIDFHGEKAGHAVNRNGQVFEMNDFTDWTEIGISSPADSNFFAVDSDGSEDVWVAGGSGHVWHYDGSWSETKVDGDSNDLKAVDVGGGEGLAAGLNGELHAWNGTEWAEEDPPTGQALRGVVSWSKSVAVGDGPTIVEK